MSTGRRTNMAQWSIEPATEKQNELGLTEPEPGLQPRWTNCD